ncbi:MAG TPA: membrane protein insertase YidC [Oscillospiraceae bacterium]|nr:membrane protein insertase YidC [Oscillospiraceae bacterium]
MWATIIKPFAWLLLAFYNWTGSYGLSVILFALAINLILMPFMGKSKKSMMRTSRLQPKLQELQRRHEGNPQRLNEETSKLYREEHINPMSGCLWSLIPFPILIGLYSVIRQPLTRMLYMTADQVATLQTYMVNMGWFTAPKANTYAEIGLLEQVHNHWSAVMSSNIAGQLSGLKDIDFSFLGLNLGGMPDWKFFTTADWSSVSSWLPALGLFLIPLVAAFMSWLSMKVSNMANPPDPKTQAQMKSMNLIMPLMSVWFCFIMPAALGVYWIANSVFGIARDYYLTIHYRKQLDKEDAVRLEQRSEREKELESKRLETERLKELGQTEQNSNTSKKKMQAKEKQSYEERRAAAEKADRAQRRARRGIAYDDAPASQVGSRHFARGRAYDPERFGADETAEENVIPELDETGRADDAQETGTVFEDEPAEETAGVETDEFGDEPEDEPEEDEFADEDDDTDK